MTNSNSVFNFNNHQTVSLKGQPKLRFTLNLGKSAYSIEKRTDSVITKTQNGTIFRGGNDTAFIKFRPVNNRGEEVNTTAVDANGSVKTISARYLLDRITTAEYGAEATDIDVMIVADLGHIDDIELAVEESRSVTIEIDSYQLGSPKEAEYNGDYWLELRAFSAQSIWHADSVGVDMINGETIAQALVDAANSQVTAPSKLRQVVASLVSKRQAKKAIKRAESQALREVAPQPEVKEAVVAPAPKQKVVAGSAFANDFQSGKYIGVNSTSSVSTSPSADFFAEVAALEEAIDFDAEVAAQEPIKAPVVAEESKAELPVNPGKGFAPEAEVSSDTDSSEEVLAALAKDKSNNMANFFDEIEEPTKEQELQVRKSYLEEKAIYEDLTDDENREYQAILKQQGKKFEAKLAADKAAGIDSFMTL